jgi:HlyD family secretion protein
LNQAQANLKTAQASLDKAQAAVSLRELELKRMETLRQQEFVPQADLDVARMNFKDARAQVNLAGAQVEQARAALNSAELDLGFTRIYSPVNGVVVSRNVDVGQTIVASLQAPTLFVIAQDLTRMQVNTNVSESDIGGVAEGKEAEFTVDAYPARAFKGTVVQVRNAPISIQNVVTYDVLIAVNNDDLKLKPGMTANVSIVTARKQTVLRVPNAALRFRMPGQPYEAKKAMVWRLDPTGSIQAVSVRAGIADASFTEVLDGELRLSDTVIIGLLEPEEPEQKQLPPGFGVGPRLR